MFIGMQIEIKLSLKYSEKFQMKQNNTISKKNKTTYHLQEYGIIGQYGRILE